MSKLIPLNVADAAVEKLQLEIKHLQLELKQKEELHIEVMKQLKDMMPKIMMLAEKVNEHSHGINLLADGLKKRDRELMYLSDLIMHLAEDLPADQEDDTNE